MWRSFWLCHLVFELYFRHQNKYNLIILLYSKKIILCQHLWKAKSLWVFYAVLTSCLDLSWHLPVDCQYQTPWIFHNRQQSAHILNIAHIQSTLLGHPTCKGVSLQGVSSNHLESSHYLWINLTFRYLMVWWFLYLALCSLWIGLCVLFSNWQHIYFWWVLCN